MRIYIIIGAALVLVAAGVLFFLRRRRARVIGSRLESETWKRISRAYLWDKRAKRK